MNSADTKPARGRLDALRRIGAKQGWYDAQAGKDSLTPRHYEISAQKAAYHRGYAMGVDAPKGTKHPFGEVTTPKVPL